MNVINILLKWVVLLTVAHKLANIWCKCGYCNIRSAFKCHLNSPFWFIPFCYITHLILNAPPFTSSSYLFCSI
jgi:hypothetical protein